MSGLWFRNVLVVYDRSMLLLGLMALLSIIAAYAVGDALIALARAVPPARPGDRFFLAVWVGLLTLAGGLLSISLVLPLPAWWMAAIAVLAGFVLWRRRVALRDHCTSLTIGDGRVAAIGFLVVLASVAFFAAKDVSHYDTGLYHLPTMVTLAEYGTISGSALLHHRFGYMSPWLALWAPMVDMLPGARLVAIGGTVAFTLLLSQAILAGTRLLAGRAQAPDLYFPVATAIIVGERAILVMVPASSPDLAVTLGIVVAFWVMLLDRDGGLVGPLLMLAAGTAALKISALPVLIGAGLQGLRYRQAVVAALPAAGSVAVVVLGGVAAVNFISSGCLIFPAALTCAEPSWGLPREWVDAISNFISDWPVASDNARLSANDIVALHDGTRTPAGLGRHAVALLAQTGWPHAAILVAGFAVAAHLNRRRRVDLAIFGLTLVFGLLVALQAPLDRFVIGWMASGLGIVCALLCGPVLARIDKWRWRPVLGPAAGHLLGAGLATVLCLALAFMTTKGDRQLLEGPFEKKPVSWTDRLLLPPVLVERQPVAPRGLLTDGRTERAEPSQWITEPAGDIARVRPENGDQCWTRPLPCTPPGEPFVPLRLRDPAAGLSGGVVTTNASD